MQALSATQQRKAQAFVRAHQVIADWQPGGRKQKAAMEKREKALRDAYAAGVHGTTLAEMSGLKPARVYQLIEALGDVEVPDQEAASG